MYLDCNSKQTSCTRKRSDPRNGCPNCEYTIQYNQFMSNLESELSVKGNAEQRRKWSIKFLLDLVGKVSHQSTLHTTYGRDWTVVTTALVNIYRDERDKIKAIESFKLHQEIEAARKQNTSGYKFTEPDEGDFD